MSWPSVLRALVAVLLCVVVLAGVSSAADQAVSLIPQPKIVEFTAEPFTIATKSRIIFTAGDKDLERIAHGFADRLKASAGLKLRVATLGKKRPGNSIILELLKDASMPEGAYSLTVSRKQVLLRASTPAGIFYGVQTLYQLLPGEVAAGQSTDLPLRLPGIRIEDEPRFRWRGYLLDASRHFQPKEWVLRLLDWMALHKLNVFHWHLTDDHGWRVEIKRYPKLTEVGAWRDQPGFPGGRYGSYYTQDDIREIVSYARERFITIVPEIEMPGHSGALLASYPQYSCSSEPTQVAHFYSFPPTREFGPPAGPNVMCICREDLYPFLAEVLSEIMDLFPGPYIHFGGDEVYPGWWEASEECGTMMRQRGFTAAAQLQGLFSRRMAEYISGKGRRVVGWDEILDGRPPAGTVVMAWRNVERGAAAAAAGYDVVMSPEQYLYFDHAQSDDPAHPVGFTDDISTLQEVYAYEPVPPGLDAAQAAHILGVQANTWTELAYSTERLELLSFPRMTALAEIAWSPPESRDWGDFLRRLKPQLRRYELLGIGYYREVPRPRLLREQVVFIGQAQVAVPVPAPDARIHYTLDGSEPTAQSPILTGPLTFTDDAGLKLRTVLPDGEMSSVTSVVLDRQEPRAGIAVQGLAPGVRFRYVEGRFGSAHEVAQAAAVREGLLPSLQLPAQRREDEFGVMFEGYLYLDRTGVYTFYTDSDDGTLLYLGDTLVVSNDGAHAPQERSGQIALQAGYHPLRLLYFERNIGEKLEVMMEGPGTPKAPVLPSLLFHNP